MKDLVKLKWKELFWIQLYPSETMRINSRMSAEYKSILYFANIFTDFHLIKNFMNLNFTLGEELILDTALQQVTGDGQPQLF